MPEDSMTNHRSQILSVGSVLLLAPALLLCAGANLYLLNRFGIENASQLLDRLMSLAVFRIVWSPFLVLGGPLVVLVLNTIEICSLTVAFEHGEWLVAFAVKRIYKRLIPLFVSGMLLTFFLVYGFVENFQVISR
jgi:hypothetical protein